MITEREWSLRIPTFEEIAKDFSDNQANLFLNTLPSSSAILRNLKYAIEEPEDRKEIIYIFTTFHNILAENGLLDDRPKDCMIGTSRLAFNLEGDCLKVAWNRRGILQNRSEIDILETCTGYSCFPRLIHVFDDNPIAYLTEYCDPFNTEDLGIRNFEIDYMAQFFNILEDNEFSLPLTKQELERNRKDMPRNYVELLGDMIEGKESTRTFRDLVDFFRKNPGRRDLMIDTGIPENWGCAKRNGLSLPIYLDLGFSKETRKMYESPW